MLFKEAATDHGGSSVRSGSATWGIAAAVVVSILLLTYLPAITLYFSQLWLKEHYRFFPFALLTTAGFWWVRCDRSSLSNASTTRWVIRSGVILLATAAQWYMLTSNSPWAGFVSMTLLTGVCLDCCRDNVSGGTLLYVILPWLLTIRPPQDYDGKLLLMLQGFSSEVASGVLTFMGVEHILQGFVIELKTGTRLMVETACSGVQSLFTLLFVASVICVLHRYSVVRSGLILLTGAVWALFLNAVRIVAIAVADHQWGYNLATGWQHDVLGYGCLAAASLLLLSADRLMLFLVAAIPDDTHAHPVANPFVSIWNVVFLSRFSDTQPVIAGESKTKSRFWLVACSVLSLGCFSLGLLTYRFLRQS